METKHKVLIGAIALVVVAVVLFYLSNYLTVTTGYGVSEEESVILAQCLSDKGIVMYGLPTCPHCIAQKEMFGGGFKLINYVDCSKNTEMCQGLEGVPAWKIQGKLYYGTQPLSFLKQLSGC